MARPCVHCGTPDTLDDGGYETCSICGGVVCSRCDCGRGEICPQARLNRRSTTHGALRQPVLTRQPVPASANTPSPTPGQRGIPAREIRYDVGSDIPDFLPDDLK